MKILFDFITTQTFFGGGGCEYIRRVYYSLIELKSNKKHPIDIIGVVDKRIPQYPYKDLSPNELMKNCTDVIDISKINLQDFIQQNHIDKFFIGVSQVWAGKYNLSNLECDVVTITHDLHDEELDRIQLYSYLSLEKGIYSQLRRIFSRYKKFLLGRKRPMAEMVDQLQTCKRWYSITVSDFSKHSFMYNYDVPEESVSVLYSPERILQRNKNVQNKALHDIITSSCTYYLIVSAGRPEKNAVKALKAFDKYRNQYLTKKGGDKLPLIVTLGFHKEKMFEGHVNLPLLSESDLFHAYYNCYALVYPSYFEGFGYPPLEAMKFGKPVIVSNVTSIPEILGTAPIYFSPFYDSDIYRAFCKLEESNYKEYSHRSLDRYSIIKSRQILDLEKLLNLLIR